MKYCNPDTCSECLYIGEGDSICEISHELVLDLSLIHISEPTRRS